MWSGHTSLEILEPNTLNVPNGGGVPIVCRVRGANNNPLVAGTTISVSIAAGTLGDFSIVLPDTQSEAYTWFTAILSDDVPEEIEAEAVTVTITVTGQNGNASTWIAGTTY